MTQIELKKITKEELNEVLRLHRMWLELKEGGVKADLSRTDLSGMDLHDANLTRACLHNANLNGTNLTHANLTRANIGSANLTSANLTRAVLTEAFLNYANLTGALMTAANLTGASVRRATIDSREIARRCICPVGTFIAWKKVCDIVGNVANPTILKLEIPSDALRVGGLTGRKCRTNKAKVLEAIGSTETSFSSRYNQNFTYTVGQCIEEPKFDPDPRDECTSGIHFFLTQIEAEEYK